MNIPVAHIVQRKSAHRFLPWMIPLIAIIAVASLMWWHSSDRGPRISIAFDHAHGLTAGASLKYRGMEVGRIDQVSVRDDRITVDVQLTKDAAFIATEGSQFWIVRPQFELTQITGIDTVYWCEVSCCAPWGRPNSTPIQRS